MIVLWELFFGFFKAGLFAVGGGLATLPFLYDIASRYDWMSVESITDMIAISESTPGPLGVNMATYAGYHAYGVLGGVVATFALVLPSIIVIVIVAKILEKFKENRLVKDTFAGLRPCVTAMIAAACWQVMETTLFTIGDFMKTMNPADLINYKAMCLFILCYWLMRRYKKHPVVYIGGAAVCGIVFRMA